MNDDNEKLKWRFDISTFKLLGRELITDRITAIFELVKNCYDANAENVLIQFINVESRSKASTIIIKDDGIGMSADDIKNKWMVIGTNSKREQTVSPHPYKRVYIGEKGIGRFAVEKLGSHLKMRTKNESDSFWNFLEIDWNKYEQMFKEQRSKTSDFFTDIDNPFWTESGVKSEKGTELIISDIREIWTEHDITRVHKELSKLISPFKQLKYPFNIEIQAEEYEKYHSEKLKSISLEEIASEYISLGYDLTGGKQQVIQLEKGRLVITDKKIYNFGPVKFNLYYFGRYAKTAFTKKYKDTPYMIDGIKIYRDGIITTPFAEYEADKNKKRDILGIDKRIWSDIFEKVGSRDLIGILEITKEHNPNIKDATNRQDFLDNLEYRSLKEFIIEQILRLEEYLKFKKDEEKKTTSDEIKSSEDNINLLSKHIQNIENKNPSLKVELELLKEQARKSHISIKKAAKKQKYLENELIRKERLYESLLSLQLFASEFAHAIRHAISEIKNKAQFFMMRFPNPKYTEIFKGYASDIFTWMTRLVKAADFMLSYSKSNIAPEELDINEVVNGVFEQYRIILDKENIKTIIEIKPIIFTFTRRLFEDIVENLLTNSIKALKSKDEKLIKCSGFDDGNNFILYFSDNGCGIRNENKEKIFEIYYTTTADDGGNGLGLWIVKKRLDILKGSIEIDENELRPSGATFKISIPFKKEKQR